MRPPRCLPLFLSLLASSVALASTPTPVGDGGSTGVRQRNQSVHPMPIALGSVGDEGIALTLDRYAEGGFVVQCDADVRGRVPELSFTVDGVSSPVEVPSTSFADGPPVLWITRARTGRAALAAMVERVMPGVTVKALGLDDVPETFAAMRFAPVIVISAGDFGALAAPRRRALGDAVAAGTTLVVTTGDAAPADDVLAELAPVRLGEVGRPAPALGDHLPRASAQRALEAGETARPLLTADGQPVVIEARRGLGQVRVVGVRLADLSAGKVSDLALQPPDGPLAHVLGWLAQAPPPGETRPSPFGAHIWILLAVLAALVLVTRRRPRTALLLFAPWWLVALILPPQTADSRLDAARVLYVPVGDGALAVGTLDLTLARGGPRTVPAADARVALEGARPGGACLVVGGDRSGWVVQGQPGSPRRITFFSMLPAMPDGADKIGALPSWPPGPLAEATLRRVVAGPLPIDLEPARLDAARVDLRPPSAKSAEAL